jgi:hypothetical protein
MAPVPDRAVASVAKPYDKLPQPYLVADQSPYAQEVGRRIQARL